MLVFRKYGGKGTKKAYSLVLSGVFFDAAQIFFVKTLQREKNPPEHFSGYFFSWKLAINFPSWIER